MNNQLLRASVFGAALTLSTAIMAQGAVYRCGPDANHYSAQACAGGRSVAVDDRRSAAQQAQAQANLQRDRALAQELRAQRLAREQEAPRVAAGIRTVSRSAPDAEALARPGPESKRKKRKPEAGRSAQAGSRVGANADPRLSFQIKLPAPRAPKAPSKSVRPSKQAIRP